MVDIGDEVEVMRERERFREVYRNIVGYMLVIIEVYNIYWGIYI